MKTQARGLFKSSVCPLLAACDMFERPQSKNSSFCYYFIFQKCSSFVNSLPRSPTVDRKKSQLFSLSCIVRRANDFSGFFLDKWLDLMALDSASVFFFSYLSVSLKNFFFSWCCWCAYLEENFGDLFKSGLLVLGLGPFNMWKAL